MKQRICETEAIPRLSQFAEGRSLDVAIHAARLAFVLPEPLYGTSIVSW